MSSIRGFNFDRAEMRMLLERLGEGRLDLDGARQLRPLLVQALKEATHANDKELKSYLLGMINIIDMYLSGEINLLEPIEITNVSNTG
jgi:hypothetical protein